MSSHKHHEHLSKIKEAITKTQNLSDTEKSDSVKRIEEWEVEDKAFGILVEELLEVSEYFEGLFSELGLK
jgi:hypothetical protein